MNSFVKWKLRHIISGTMRDHMSLRIPNANKNLSIRRFCCKVSKLSCHFSVVTDQESWLHWRANELALAGAQIINLTAKRTRMKSHFNPRFIFKEVQSHRHKMPDQPVLEAGALDSPRGLNLGAKPE